MDVTLTSVQFDIINRIFKKETGIEYPESKKGLIAFRLLLRMKKLDINSIDEYIRRIQAGNIDEELQELTDLLTTNETSFFREKAHFEYLNQTILPQLSNNKEVRVWSAACASGEEVYSLAMVLNEFQGAFNWKILGSDINETVLTKAIAGIYANKKMDSIPRVYLRKYFTSHRSLKKECLMVNELIYKNISFMKINLTEAIPSIGKFDIIFLRNALIYFKDDMKKQIIDNVIKHLKPDGFFVIGHSDSILNCKERFIFLKNAPGIYQIKS